MSAAPIVTVIRLASGFPTTAVLMVAQLMASHSPLTQSHPAPEQVVFLLLSTASKPPSPTDKASLPVDSRLPNLRL